MDVEEPSPNRSTSNPPLQGRVPPPRAPARFTPILTRKGCQALRQKGSLTRPAEAGALVSLLSPLQSLMTLCGSVLL